MPSAEGLGLERLIGIHYYVRDLERSRRFYVELMDFAEVAESSPELVQRGRQRSLVFRAGDCCVVCSTPEGTGGRAWRYFQKHPDGIGTIAFQVRDIERTFRTLEARGGTPIGEILRVAEDGGEYATFSITTPFGDTTFRFIQYSGGFDQPFPGLVPSAGAKAPSNRFGFERVDHITSNFQTMKPTLLWLEHVLGFEPYWSVEFHTRDVARHELREGSGLRSAVYWDPVSGIKFANNEPYRPYFKNSQINLFNEDHRGDGVQHVALTTRDILSTVRGLRERGVVFMPTPDAYYDALPQRLQRDGIGSIAEDLDELRELGILVDGDGPGKYLLQVFLKDAAGLYRNPAAGPFFFEIIQRKGDEGFGAGNFRALFESIEREQVSERR